MRPLPQPILLSSTINICYTEMQIIEDVQAVLFHGTVSLCLIQQHWCMKLFEYQYHQFDLLLITKIILWLCYHLVIKWVTTVVTVLLTQWLNAWQHGLKWTKCPTVRNFHRISTCFSEYPPNFFRIRDVCLKCQAILRIALVLLVVKLKCTNYLIKFRKTRWFGRMFSLRPL